METPAPAPSQATCFSKRQARVMLISLGFLLGAAGFSAGCRKAPSPGVAPPATATLAGPKTILTWTLSRPFFRGWKNTSELPTGREFPPSERTMVTGLGNEAGTFRLSVTAFADATGAEYEINFEHDQKLVKSVRLSDTDLGLVELEPGCTIQLSKGPWPR